MSLTNSNLYTFKEITSSGISYVCQTGESSGFVFASKGGFAETAV
jgi:hypothetical protein